MNKFFFLLTLTLSLAANSKAQVTLWNDLKKSDTTTLTNDSSIISEQNEPLFIPETLDTNIDSLLRSWNIKYFVKDFDSRGNHSNPVTSDEEIALRLSQIPHVVDLPFNDIVRKYIDFYLAKRRNVLQYMLGLTNFYFPIIEQALDTYKLPLELKYLTIVESALDPTAFSRMGASGLWQFMLPTGKSYGLEINSLVDERRDPVKSSLAACKYLKTLYDTFNDWHLVIAAYNCGPSSVNKAIKRAKGKRNFWEIYPYLPKETRSYVPLFIAATYAMNYYSKHNLYPVQTQLPLSTDTVMVDKLIHFDQISEVLNVDKDLIRALNPQYVRDIIPGNSKPYPLLLPTVYAYGYIELEDTITTHRADQLFTEKNVVKSGEATREKITHKVKSGETLSKIASRYGVTTTQIKKWNGLRSNKIAKGRNLTLYIDNGGIALKSSKNS